MNQKNLHQASGYDLRDELNHKRATDQEHKNRQYEDQPRGQERRGNEKNGNRSHKGKEERGNNPGNQNKLPRPKKNTENFNPSHEAPPMRVVVAAPGLSKYNKVSTTRDVIIVSDLFGDQTLVFQYVKLQNHTGMNFYSITFLKSKNKFFFTKSVCFTPVRNSRKW